VLLCIITVIVSHDESMTSFLQKIKGVLLDVLFPPICLGCRTYLDCDDDVLICTKCMDNIPIFGHTFYKTRFFTLMSVTTYENKAVRKLIHYYKYEGFTDALVPLGKLLENNLDILRKNIPNDTIVIPIPIHPIRKRKRGFNQAEELAKIVGNYLNLKLDSTSLTRIRNTDQQIKIGSDKKRYENIKGCFGITDNLDMKGKTVLLVDDVYTSGATINEAVKVLRKAHAKEIIGIVVAN